MVNGTVLHSEEAVIVPFLKNDPLLLTIKMWFGFGGIPLFTENMSETIEKLRSLNVQPPPLLLDNQEFFRRVKRMLNKNRCYRSGTFVIQLFIADGKVDFFAFAKPHTSMQLPANEKGVFANFATYKKYSDGHLKNIQLFNRFFTLSEQRINTDKNVKPIFLNEKGVVCDAGTANVFIVENKKISTPSLSTGCTSNAFRNLVLNVAKDLGYSTNESEKIVPTTVLNADEIFLAEETTGIQWVMGIGNRRFVHNISNAVNNRLNKVLHSLVERNN